MNATLTVRMVSFFFFDNQIYLRKTMHQEGDAIFICHKCTKPKAKGIFHITDQRRLLKHMLNEQNL